MNSEKRKSEDDGAVVEKKSKNEDVLGHNYRLIGYHTNRKGERQEMQDSHRVLDDFQCELTNAPNDEIRVAYYAVFDGHAGARAAQFAADNLHLNWASTLSPGMSFASFEQNAKRCFIDAYKETDDQFLSQAVKGKPVWKDGTTATAVFIVNNVVYVTNLGDSRAILSRYKVDEDKEIPIVLTVDHSPTNFEERMRIQKAGGNVKDGRVMGILEVSRSIGDGHYKSYGVTCVPDIKKCSLTLNDRYILIACDGLWKTFDKNQVVQYIAELRRQIWKDEKLLTEEKPLDALRWETLCHRLAAEAIRRGSGDNVTILIIVIGDKWYDLNDKE